MIERFYFKKHIAAADWVMVAVMFAGLIILINPFQGIHSGQFRTGAPDHQSGDPVE